MDIKFTWKKRLLIIPPVLIGVLILALSPMLKKAPTSSPKKANVDVVRVLEITPRSIQPSIQGYGHIAPTDEWQAHSELSGSVSWVSDKLKSGMIIKKGEKLIEIDPASYELIVTQIEANIEVSKLKDQATKSSLTIAQKEYNLQKSEYKRFERLSKKGNVSKTAKDSALSKYLASQQQLQNLKNSLLINQGEQKVLQSQLNIAKLDLEKTVIYAPFNSRITETSLSISEYVNKGQLLLKADGLDSIEVAAQFPIGKMRPLRNNLSQQSNNKNAHLKASVSLQTLDRVIVWDAEIDRTGAAINLQTQSQSIVVRVDSPYKKASPGSRPPLVRNTFVQVTLTAPVLNDRMIIPSNAIHNNNGNNHVYVLDSNDKLVITPITVDFIQQQVTVIKTGLALGDKLILTPLSPAINGMKLKGKVDKKINQWLDNTTKISGAL